jgi:spore maturation protein CgeB
VDESTVKFCTPGDPASLAASITWLLDHQEDAERMAEKGKEIVKKHSWHDRMRRIIGT